MRLFIAIDLPENVKTYLESVCKKFDNMSNIKLVQPQNLHITLKFLGEVNEKRLELVKTHILQTINQKRFSLKLGKLGKFPETGKYCRVLWIGVLDNGETKKLSEILNDSLASIDFENNNDFKAHITLARFNGRTDLEELKNIIEKIKLQKLEFIVDKIALKRSNITAAGPTYENVFEVQLV